MEISNNLVKTNRGQTQEEMLAELQTITLRTGMVFKGLLYQDLDGEFNQKRYLSLIDGLVPIVHMLMDRAYDITEMLKKGATT
jgi:hypothetical protein